MLVFSKKRDIISLKSILDILPLNTENWVKIIKIVKYPAYPDSRFSRHLVYLRILILGKTKSRKAKTNIALPWLPPAIYSYVAP